MEEGPKGIFVYNLHPFLWCLDLNFRISTLDSRPQIDLIAPMPKPKLTLYVDIVSPFAYLAFQLISVSEGSC